jgi:hypothetical protein
MGGEKEGRERIIARGRGREREERARENLKSRSKDLSSQTERGNHRWKRLIVDSLALGSPCAQPRLSSPAHRGPILAMQSLASKKFTVQNFV